MMRSKRNDDQGFFAIIFLKRPAARFSLAFGSGGEFKAASTIRLSRADSWISGVNCSLAACDFAGSLAKGVGFFVVTVAIAPTIPRIWFRKW